MSAPSGKADEVYTVIDGTHDLPVYRLVDDRYTFDPSAVIALIEQSIVPESWGEDATPALPSFRRKRRSSSARRKRITSGCSCS